MTSLQVMCVKTFQKRSVIGHANLRRAQRDDRLHLRGALLQSGDNLGATRARAGRWGPRERTSWLAGRDTVVPADD